MAVVASLVVGAIMVLLLDGRLRGAQSWLIGREDEVAAAAIQKLRGEVQSRPEQEWLARLAERIATILDCGRTAIFWQKEKLGTFSRVNSHPVARAAPLEVAADDSLIAESLSHNEAWLLPGSLAATRAWLEDYRICVPVFEGGSARLLILLGESERAFGYSVAEMSALEALGVTISHNLSLQEMIARQTQQEQLALAGKLAAGIAHNIRNPLAVVRACLEVDSTLPNGAARELHEAATVKVRSIQSTVDSLSALARGERFALDRHDLALLVRGVLVDQADYLAQCGARVAFAATEGAWWGLIEPHQLAIALTNLLRNAAEEIAKNPEGGTISIDVLRSPEYLWMIRVADTGRGLPQHIVEAVFSRDLFAKTTKAEGRPARKTGYGIGLHSTMMIITTGHGGRFEYREGAFHVSVPAAD
jgi:signal transduction histidine kinase